MMSRSTRSQMTQRQFDQVVYLRQAIENLDVKPRKTAAGARIFKEWHVQVLTDGRVVVESTVGYPTHTFDDITREIFIGKRGGLKGWGNKGHGRAGEGHAVGPRTLYRLNRQRIY